MKISLSCQQLTAELCCSRNRIIPIIIVASRVTPATTAQTKCHTDKESAVSKSRYKRQFLFLRKVKSSSVPSSIIKNMSKSTVSLQQKKDWVSWKSEFIRLADSFDLWDKIDPDENDPQPLLVKPKIPQRDDYFLPGMTTQAYLNLSVHRSGNSGNRTGARLETPETAVATQTTGHFGTPPGIFDRCQDQGSHHR